MLLDPQCFDAASNQGNESVCDHLFVKVMAVHLPTSTYRFQFNYNFTLKQAGALIDYLSDLGITDCYASPLTLARRGSLHGYDVTDHSIINPEIGGAAS